MNKPVTGVAVGAVLGVVDGMTAWFTPEVRPLLMGILIGSCFKGMLVGLLSGFFARKVRSDAAGIAAGAGLGLLFAYAVAAMPSAKRGTLLFADHGAGLRHRRHNRIPNPTTGNNSRQSGIER